MLFLNNSKEGVNYKKSYKMINEEPVDFKEFLSAIETPFFQSAYNEFGFNHLYVKGNTNVSLIGTNYEKLNKKCNEKGIKGDLYYKLCCANGTGLQALNHVVLTVNLDKEKRGLYGLFNAIGGGRIARPTAITVGNNSTVAVLIYSFVVPFLITGANYFAVSNPFHQVQKRFSYLFNLPDYLGARKKVKSVLKGEELVVDENGEVKVQKEYLSVLKQASSYCRDTLKIDVCKSKMYVVGGLYANICEVLEAFGTSEASFNKEEKHSKIGKKTINAMNLLKSLYNEQKYIYSKTADYNIEDMLAMQSSNYFKKALLLSKVNPDKAYELIELLFASFVNSNKDELYIRRALFELLSSLNSKLTDKYKLSSKRVLELLALNKNDRISFARNYSFDKDKHILVENGIHLYQKSFEELRNFKYVEEKLTRIWGKDGYTDEIFAEELIHRTYRRKFKFNCFDSKKAMIMLNYFITNENATFDKPTMLRKILKLSYDVIYHEGYRKSILNFLENNKDKTVEEKLALANFLHIRGYENKRVKELKVKVFENDNVLTLDNLQNLAKKGTTNVKVSRKRNDIKVFYFISKGIKVIYNYLSKMSQVFVLKGAEISALT